MSSRKPRPLAPGYTVEIDTLHEPSWCQLVHGFEDGNIYQTEPYGSVVAGEHNLSHLVLKLNGAVVAIAQARIKKLPVLGFGVAYIHWGPLWRRIGEEVKIETLRQAVRALRNEYVCRRHLTLRIFPIIFDDDALDVRAILTDEGLSPIGEGARSRTILFDLAHPLDDIREGMSSHCKRKLKAAEKENLKLTEGSSEELFHTFIAMYKEMVSRKKFVEPNDIYQFLRIQTRLPEALKMKILLCQSENGFCAGVIYSLIGNRGIYLFGATSNAGLKSNGSYLLQWKVTQALKLQGATIYNLNGITPARNPGTYRFKSGLAGKHGRDVSTWEGSTLTLAHSAVY